MLRLNGLGLVFTTLGIGAALVAHSAFAFASSPITCIAIAGGVACILDLLYRSTLGDFDNGGGQIATMPAWIVAFAIAIIPTVIVTIDAISGDTGSKDNPAAHVHKRRHWGEAP